MTKNYGQKIGPEDRVRRQGQKIGLKNIAKRVDPKRVRLKN
jgi:hypothetical protein